MAGIAIDSPVLGFTPVRAARSFCSKMPRSVMRTLLPFATFEIMRSDIAVSTLVTSARFMPVAFAIFPTSSLVFIIFRQVDPALVQGEEELPRPPFLYVPFAPFQQDDVCRLCAVMYPGSVQCLKARLFRHFGHDLRSSFIKDRSIRPLIVSFDLEDNLTHGRA